MLAHARQPLLQIAVAGPHEHETREVGLEARRGLDLTGHPAERILRRGIAVRRRKERGALHVGVVVGAARARADPAHPLFLEHAQQRARVGERGVEVVVHEQAERAVVAVAARLRHPAAALILAVGHGVEDGQAYRDPEAGHRGPDPVDHAAQEARAVEEPAAVTPLAFPGGEQLVAQVAMAVLHVHEGEPRLLGQARGGHEIRDQAVQLLVGEAANLTREAAIQDRVRVGDEGLRAVRGVGPREAAGMGELQADVEVGVGLGTETLAVRADEMLAQPGQALLRLGADLQLVRVGAAFRPHRDRFPAPDELGSADPEAAPTPLGQLARLPLARPVPALHGQDAEPVADADSVHVDGPSERRRRAGGELGIEPEPDADLVQVRAEVHRRPQGGDTPIPRIRRGRNGQPCTGRDSRKAV